MIRAVPRQQPGMCRLCGKPVPKNRRAYCSKECAKQFNIAYFPSHTRWHVYKRDHGVCAKCGCDTDKLKRIIMRARHWMSSSAVRSVVRELGFTDYLFHGNLWQADHIQECINGGWGTGLENLRTLCTPCHRAETARLARERAEKRKRKKLGATLFEATNVQP